MILKRKNGIIIFLILILLISTFAHSEGQEERTSVTISLAGDVLLADSVGRQMDIHGVDYPWESVKDIFLGSDLSLINLECTVGTIGEPQDKEYTYRAKPETLKGLVNAGIDGVSLGNNHSLDYGRECFVQTLDHLEEHKIKYTGGGRNIKALMEPAIWEINNIKIGFIGFSRVTPSVDWYATENRAGIVNGYDSNAKNMLEIVEKAKEKVDFLIVSLHWGVQLADYPREIDVNIAKKLIDSGADCIMGHHPHVLQGIEFYNNKPIVYSLGNFAFATRKGRTSQTMVFNMEINKEGIMNTSIVPADIIGSRPIISEGEEREEIINLINTLSAQWGTVVSEDGNITGNIEYVDPIKPESNEERIETQPEELEDDTEVFEENSEVSFTDKFISLISDYGLQIFIVSGILSLLLLAVVLISVSK